MAFLNAGATRLGGGGPFAPRHPVEHAVGAVHMEVAADLEDRLATAPLGGNSQVVTVLQQVAQPRLAITPACAAVNPPPQPRRNPERRYKRRAPLTVSGIELQSTAGVQRWA